MAKKKGKTKGKKLIVVSGHKRSYDPRKAPKRDRQGRFKRDNQGKLF